MVRIGGGLVTRVGPHGRAGRVRVGAFFMDQTEVQVRDYIRCISSGACSSVASLLGPGCNLMNPARFNHPVNCAQRATAAVYCRWVGKRLPTIAEWQLAAGGPEGRAFPWGEASHPRKTPCWSALNTCAVDAPQRGATPSGLADMAGNVWEISEPVCQALPPRPGLCARYTSAVHGGGWTSCSREGRGCQRHVRTRSIALLDRVKPAAVGFRCVRSAEAAPAARASLP